MATVNTSIEWTDATWSPVRGCSRVSPGCDHCYAMGQAHRFSGPGKPYDGLTTIRRGKVDWSGRVRFVPKMLDAPLRWRKPRRVFVNSMSDLFHESLSNEDIAAVFGVMAAAPQHTFQVLTKRADRMRALFALQETKREVKFGKYAGVQLPDCGWLYQRTWQMQLRYRPGHVHSWHWPLPNVWLGVSAEDQQRADERIPHLLATPAAVRFVSAEPLLGSIDLSRYVAASGPSCDDLPCLECGSTTDCPCGPDSGPVQLDWVIVGGESGHGARPCDVQWVRDIVRQCRDAGVACFVKQLGAHPYEERPADGGAHGTAEALARFGERHPQTSWFPGWTLTHTSDGQSSWIRHLSMTDRKGGDMDEWPSALQVRQWPEVRA